MRSEKTCRMKSSKTELNKKYSNTQQSRLAQERAFWKKNARVKEIHTTEFYGKQVERELACLMNDILNFEKEN